MHRTAIYCAGICSACIRSMCCVLRCCILCEIRHYMPCCYMIRLYILCASSLYAVLLYILCSTQACHRVRKKIRQKLYTRAQFMPLPSQIPAETVQPCKINVAYAPKNGRNFTAVRSLCCFPARFRQKLYAHVQKKSFPRQKTAKALQLCKETVVCAP